MSKNQETEIWKKAVKYAATALWTLVGLAFLVPAVPFYFVEQNGLIWSVVFSILCTIAWLAPAYYVFVKPDK